MNLMRAKELRKDTTDAEKRLWPYLRAMKRPGFHFRRQAPIGRYVADFCCHAARLIIEVDGGQHHELADAKRTKWLDARGYKVLRYWNNDVMKNSEGVVAAIADDFQARAIPHPNPSPQGGGASSNASSRN